MRRPFRARAERIAKNALTELTAHRVTRAVGRALRANDVGAVAALHTPTPCAGDHRARAVPGPQRAGHTDRNASVGFYATPPPPAVCHY